MKTIETGEGVSAYRWVVMSIWLVSSVSGFMVVATLGILLPSITEELVLSPTQQGLLGSAAFWGNLTLAVPLSWWTSRFGPKILTTVTLVLATAFLFLQGWAPVFLVLLLGRLGFGFTVIARQPAQALLMQQWFPPRKFIVVNSVGNALFGVVVGGGLAVAPFMLDSLGGDWRTTLNVFGAFFALLTILWVALGRERVTRDYRALAASQGSNLLRGALRYRDLWIAGFGFLGATLSWFAFITFFPTMMLDSHQVSLRWSGSLLALSIFMGGVSGLGFGWAAMVTGKGKFLLQVLGALMAVTFAGMTLSGSILLLAGLSFMNGVAWGFWPILYTVPFQLPGIRPREVAVAVGLFTMMISVGTTLGALITGLLQDNLGDLKLALFIVSFASLSLCVSGTLLRHGTTPSEDPAAAMACQGTGEYPADGVSEQQR